jgi:cytochrome oxidase assembly protein ShyY1
VIASGRYDRASQRYVASRELDGRPGVWVVAPLTLADGTVVAVLRGWVADVDEAADAPPTGEVRVDGVLQPGETFYRSAPVRPDGLLLTISDEALREVWGGDLRSGVVVLESERPRPAAAPVPVPPTVRSADVSFPLQNFFYAIQWWVFAAFAVFVWVRWLRLDVRAAQEAETGRVAAGG